MEIEKDKKKENIKPKQEEMIKTKKEGDNR